VLRVGGVGGKKGRKTKKRFFFPEISGKTVEGLLSPLTSGAILYVHCCFGVSVGTISLQVNVYTTPGKKAQGQFALGVACKILTFFTEYFRIAYPLP